MKKTKVLILSVLLIFLSLTISASAFNFYWVLGQPSAVFDTTSSTTTYQYGFVLGQPTLFYDTTASSTITQRHYRWRYDNGSESSATYLAAEDTALSQNIFVGDKVRLRMLISNTGNRPASRITYRLEYASTSCDTWISVPTTGSLAGEHWVMSLSSHVVDGATTTDSSGLTNPSGTFVGGQVKTSANQTIELSLAASNTEFTELEYSINSTSDVTANTTYCFRATNAGGTANFSYLVEPQITLLPNSARAVGGGSSLESDGGGTPVGGGDPDGGDPVEDPPADDGPPVGGGGPGGGGDSG